MRRKLYSCLFLACAVFFLSPARVFAAQKNGDLDVKGGDYGTDYSYEDHVLTVLSGTPLTISGETRKDVIRVKDGIDASLTFDHVSIRVLKNAALDIQNAEAELRFKGENVLKSGMRRPGIHVGEYGTLTLSGQKEDKLYAVGGARAAGIGSDSESACGNINLEGGRIYATGGAYAAGIGSGNEQDCGDITISGGCIVSRGGMLAADIGPAQKEARGGTVSLEGGELYADVIEGTLAFEHGMLSSGDLTEVRGNYRLSYPFEIQEGKRLYIGEGAELAIPQSMECSNRGDIYVYGDLELEGKLVNDGTLIDYSGELLNNNRLTGNEAVVRDIWDIQMENGDVTFTADGYEQNGMKIHTSVAEALPYHIYGEGKELEYHIVVEQDLEIGLIFDEVLLAPLGGRPALSIGQGADIDLELKGENRFTCTELCIQIGKKASLEMDGGGSLIQESIQ